MNKEQRIRTVETELNISYNSLLCGHWALPPTLKLRRLKGSLSHCIAGYQSTGRMPRDGLHDGVLKQVQHDSVFFLTFSPLGWFIGSIVH